MKRMHREDRGRGGFFPKRTTEKNPRPIKKQSGENLQHLVHEDGVSNRISTHQRFLSNGKRPTYIVFL